MNKHARFYLHTYMHVNTVQKYCPKGIGYIRKKGMLGLYYT